MLLRPLCVVNCEEGKDGTGGKVEGYCGVDVEWLAEALVG
jgi:hypothetical protein